MNKNHSPQLTETAGPAEYHRTGFWSLFATQFQGAFSDNVFKFLVIFLVVGAGMSTEQRDKLVPLVGALFALPFILFSMAGGFLADRFSKRSVAVGTKVFEIFVMSIGLMGFALHSVPLLLATVFLMSTQSAFFGPAKYGLLPELLPEKRLSWGNGIIGLGTFVAIITGTMLAGVLSDAFGTRQAGSGIILVALAAVGFAASLGITRMPPADPAKKFQPNFLADLLRHLRMIGRDRVLSLAVAGNVYFWFLGALLQPTVLFYGKDLLALNDKQSGLLQATLALGIGIGSATAGVLSGRKIEYGLVPFGALGMAATGAVIGYFEPSFRLGGIVLGALGFFAGFYIVPINALIQHRPERGEKGAVIATAALLSFVGIFLASAVYYLLVVQLGLDPRQIFLVTAGMTLAGAVYAICLLPDSLLRLALWCLTHTFYKIRVEGRDNIPEKGGALLVSNHMSLADGLLLIASTDRRIRFLIHKSYYDRLWMKPIARLMGMIPIASEQNPREMVSSLRAASEAIRCGEVVCIFAEGQISRTGHLLPFRRGFERIMNGVDAPILPVHLDGVWGSIFSFAGGSFLRKLPRRVPYPVTVSYGKPLPPTAEPFEVRQAVQDLASEAWHHRRRRMQPLHRSFVKTARMSPFRFAMSDARVPKLTFGAALTKTVFLARRLRGVWEGQPMAGILMPPSCAGALVNFAALLMGKVPVNLNYTLSEEALASCARQCKIETIVTSKLFLSRLKLKVPGKVVFLEDLADKPRFIEKISAFLMAWALPVTLLEKALGREKPATLDDLATVIFSSGSTGDPKGVMLSHYNIRSNIEQLAQVFPLGKDDRLLGVLPFFHSFGFTGALCFPAVLGTGVAYHPNPLDAGAIGDLVRRDSVTMLLATPTFLQIYMRSCTPEQFSSLRYVLVGAEKLPERLARAFESKYGLLPLEAYGATECAPGVAVNTLDFRRGDIHQVGAKLGKIGHPLPGVSVRIVDPESRQPLPMGQSGLLLVRGPNVMSGYLGRPDLTDAVLREGWYSTGDIAALDEDGFLQITDRLSRFSKIGGEMVPHVKVEEVLQEMSGVSERVFAVTAIPDERKGERLIVLHMLDEAALKGCLEKLSAADLPNLWKPRAEQFHRVDAFPMLGTGKLDLRGLKTKALEKSAEKTVPECAAAEPLPNGTRLCPREQQLPTKA